MQARSVSVTVFIQKWISIRNLQHLEHVPNKKKYILEQYMTSWCAKNSKIGGYGR